MNTIEVFLDRDDALYYLDNYVTDKHYEGQEYIKAEIVYSEGKWRVGFYDSRQLELNI